MHTVFVRNRRAILSIAIAAVVGDIAWCGRPSAIPLSLIFPPVALTQRTRGTAYAVGFAYYAGASWPLIPGARVFFGPYATVALAVLLWMAAAAILAAPWALVGPVPGDRSVWRGPLALVLAAVPPIGIIGWASPLTSAGILFPGTQWLGLIATMALTGLAAMFPRSTVCAAVIAATAANALHHGAAPPPTWEAVNTEFGGAGFGPRDPVSDFASAQWIQTRALESHARVIVFPESAVSRWNEATEMFWQPTLALLKASGKTILLGAGVSKPSSGQFDNVLLIRGAQNGPDLPQRIPVPIGMWRPGTPTGVPIHLWGSGTVNIAGERAAILICYEQLLVWPILISVTAHPTLIIGIANDYWAAGTRIPAVQSAVIKAWANLIGIPALTAINSIVTKFDKRRDSPVSN
jgi:hypothetical protein